MIKNEIFSNTGPNNKEFFSSIDDYESKKKTLMELKEPNRENILKVFDIHFNKNETLYNSSEAKDIVVFLGKTGVGKSTILNFLCGIRLVQKKGDLVLEDDSDQTAMKIGTSGQSETYLPKFLNLGKLQIYDFPGFADNRGPLFSLLNACYIKNILEKAESVKLVFVTSTHDILSERGKSFKDLIDITHKLIPDTDIKISSCLIINQTNKEDSIYDVIEMLQLKIDSGIIDPWVKTGYICKMTSREQLYSERLEIYKNLTQTPSLKILSVNTNEIYADDANSIKNIYKEEIKEISENYFKTILEKFYSPNPTIEILKKFQEFLKNEFILKLKKKIDFSKLISLIRPISEDIYKEVKKDIEELYKHKLETLITTIDKEILKLEEIIKRQKLEKEIEEQQKIRILAENKLREEENLRIIAEQKIIEAQKIRDKLEMERREEKRRRIEAEEEKLKENRRRQELELQKRDAESKLEQIRKNQEETKKKLLLREEEKNRFESRINDLENKLNEEENMRIEAQKKSDKLYSDFSNIREQMLSWKNKVNNLQTRENNIILQNKTTRGGNYNKKSSYSDKEEFLISIDEKNVKKKDLKNSELIESLNKNELKKMKNDDLKYILNIRNQSYSGNKNELVDRIRDYFIDIKKQDKKLEGIITTNKIQDFTNDALKDALKERCLSQSGNKNQKIKTLKNYLNNKY
jgi:hypothetical protein